MADRIEWEKVNPEEWRSTGGAFVIYRHDIQVPRWGPKPSFQLYMEGKLQPPPIERTAGWAWLEQAKRAAEEIVAVIEGKWSSEETV